MNRSNRVHPMHIHGFQFRVLERTSAPVDAGEPAVASAVQETTAASAPETSS